MGAWGRTSVATTQMAAVDHHGVCCRSTSRLPSGREPPKQACRRVHTGACVTKPGLQQASLWAGRMGPIHTPHPRHVQLAQPGPGGARALQLVCADNVVVAPRASGCPMCSAVRRAPFARLLVDITTMSTERLSLELPWEIFCLLMHILATAERRVQGSPHHRATRRHAQRAPDRRRAPIDPGLPTP